MADSHWSPSQVTVNRGDAGDLTFDVWTSGPDDGPVVLALHGFPQGAQSFREIAELLADRGIKTIAFDQRGYSPGARPEPTELYRDDILAEDAIAVARALGHQEVNLVGHDWGSHIAWVTAARYPDAVRTLTAVSVPHPAAYADAYKHDSDQAERAEYIKYFWKVGEAEEGLLADDGRRLREALDDVPPELIDYYVARLQEPGALTAALNYYRAMHPGSAKTPVVTVPTTYVWSDNDRALGRVGAEACEQYVDADYEFVVLEGISHWIPERAPEPLANAIASRIATP
ncbi:alpha/beta fold hydrolase [Epidermidibacterium keratini]|uniref:Alpha/beta fold hydrolase n=1 Tax=Epidermidibacterium keratini TaxID=1891644 RepID=A0A7L4YQT9_9ACTN|nr:alpha/beta hydrolase [Epidermidibacterium keratini]QHC01601.1 alpha/beta fold hydrolase [Epidermidibacterium keratini]